METSQLIKFNNEALSKRFWIQSDYQFKPISSHNKNLHKFRREYPYFGYIDILIDNVQPFVMFSNNDDLVAQTYFFYGYNSYETLSINIWRELALKYKFIFDIGGFTGLYTIVAAKVNSSANLFVFEPIKRIFGRLIINLSVNQLGTRVVAVDQAIGNNNEQCEMNIFQGNITLSTGSSLIPKAGKKINHKEFVDVTKFDKFILEREIECVDLLKIDVEQAELIAIEGMNKTIQEYSPQILIEVTTVKRLFELYDKLSIYNYNFVVIDDMSQKAYINSFDAFGIGSNTTHNVLFTTLSEQKISEFFEKIKGVKVYSNNKQLIIDNKS
jgi:FkbM family methyltransferase